MLSFLKYPGREELEMIYDVSSVQEAVEELTEDMNSESDNKKEATETSEPVSEETVCFFDGLLPRKF